MLVFIPVMETVIVALAIEQLRANAVIPIIMVVCLFTFCFVLVYESYKEQNNARKSETFLVD